MVALNRGNVLKIPTCLDIRHCMFTENLSYQFMVPMESRGGDVFYRERIVIYKQRNKGLSLWIIQIPGHLIRHSTPNFLCALPSICIRRQDLGHWEDIIKGQRPDPSPPMWTHLENFTNWIKCSCQQFSFRSNVEPYLRHESLTIGYLIRRLTYWVAS